MTRYSDNPHESRETEITSLFPMAGQANAYPLSGGKEELIMEILSLNTCAEKLGTTVRTLRHYLTKEQVVPYRQLELGGNTHVRYFTGEDFTRIQAWWKGRHASKEA